MRHQPARTVLQSLGWLRLWWALIAAVRMPDREYYSRLARLTQFADRVCVQNCDAQRARI